MQQTTGPKLRVAVLGGGMGALAAALALTDPHNPAAARVELTIHQLGWRLGGKGASGRSRDPATYGRIEEHGLHNLFGFYDETFRLMRRVYDELREHGSERGEFMARVAPESAAVFVEDVGGSPRAWHIHNPTNARVPGDEGELTLAEVLELALGFVRLNVRGHASATPQSPGEMAALRAALRGVELGLRGVLRLASPELAAAPWWQQLAALVERVPVRVIAAPLELARRLAFAALRARLDDDGPRRLWLMIHFASAVALGLVRDHVCARGLESLNHLDFRAWLRPHMLDDGGVLERSVLLRVLYDSSFAYRAGDTRADAQGAPAADYEAGTLLAGLLRATFTYKGAFGWKLRGGTGDVLIAPIYELLRARGVRFCFFHRADSLIPSAEGHAIERIVLTEQARVRSGEYEPLVAFEGERERCWPNQPCWDQLEQGESLIGLDLEDPRVTPPHARALELERGRDFDLVVLGIAQGALAHVAAPLLAQSHRWRLACDHVATTRTQALQVWLRAGATPPGHAELGSQPITGFWYDEDSPLNVWADMSHLLADEGWRGGERPGHLSYYVSPLADAIAESDAHAQVREHAMRVLAGAGAPHVRAPDAPAFAWSDLVDRRRDAPSGEPRLDAQYLRANTHPSDRYVLSVAGSTVHRLPPYDPEGFRNLVLAGDWTRNGMNCGAMESAVRGGLLAARALGDLLA